MEHSKTEVGRSVTVIGYVIDLDRSLVSISTKNFLRVLYGLGCIDALKCVSVRLMQRFGSWVSRYSTICIYLRPLARTIHQSYIAHIKTPDKHFALSADVLRALRVFRAIFLSSMVSEVHFTRSISSFTPQPVSITIEFDASLFGGGIIYFDAEGVCLGVSAISLESLCFGVNAAFQNSAEFIVAVVALLGSIQVIPSFMSASICFRGDSVSALTWLQSGYFRSNTIRNASILFIHICAKCHLHITEAIHIPAEKNVSADRLSRNTSFEDVLAHDDRLSSSTPIVPIPFIVEALKLCHPDYLDVDSDEAFIEHWKAVNELVDKIIEGRLFGQRISN